MILTRARRLATALALALLATGLSLAAPGTATAAIAPCPTGLPTTLTPIDSDVDDDGDEGIAEPAATTYDLAGLITRTDGAAGPVYGMTSGETMQIQYDAGLKRYYQVKNQQWEEIAYTTTRIRRYRDTSPDGVNWYGLYSNGGATLGDDWVQRYVSVGTTLMRSPTVKFYKKSDCSLVSSGVQTSRIVVLKLFASKTIGGVALTGVAKLRVELNINNTWVRWEDFFYARNVGLVKFVAYNPYGAGQPQIFKSRITGFGGNAPTREAICTP